MSGEEPIEMYVSVDTIRALRQAAHDTRDLSLHKTLHALADEMEQQLPRLKEPHRVGAIIETIPGVYFTRCADGLWIQLNSPNNSRIPYESFGQPLKLIYDGVEP